MFRTAFMLSLVWVLASCASVSRFEKGTLTAHGERLGGAAEVLYYAIDIQFDPAALAEPEIGQVRVKLVAAAPAMPLAGLSPATVAAYLPKFVPPPQWPEAWKKRAQADDAYEGGGFYIRFEGGRLASVGLCSHCSDGRASPVVGTPDGQRTYALPLTRVQLVDVFGEPSRERKAQEVRY